MLTGADWEEERRSHMGCSNHPLHSATHFPSKEATVPHCPMVSSFRTGSHGACGTSCSGENKPLQDYLWLSPGGLAAYPYLSKIKFYFC